MTLQSIAKKFESKTDGLGWTAWVETNCNLYSGRTVLFVDFPYRHEPQVFFSGQEAEADNWFSACMKRYRA